MNDSASAPVAQTLSHQPTAVTGAPHDPTLPERIGRYRILRLLGRGGMGAVYLADDTQLQRRVALKVPTFAVDENPVVLERFYREARTAARLQHPNICPVYDVDQVDGTHYLTMAYLDGDTLSAHVPAFAAGDPRKAAELVRTLALALDEAHRQGIVHRDLKPSNIMMNRRGEPVVMDFGLAREIKSATSDLSHPGMIMGTPLYMAPEQARGDVTALGPGCDIYSLGVVLFQLLAGEVPFQGTTLDVLAKHLHIAPPSPLQHRPDLDPRLEAVCLKAMAKEPSQRFLSMADFAQAIDDYLANHSAHVAAPTSCDPVLERTIAETLLLLRTWGWEAGVEKVQARLTKWEEDKPDWLPMLQNWLAGRPEAADAARERFGSLRQCAILGGWSRLGELYLANRNHNFDHVRELLKQLSAESDPRDNILQAEIHHQRAFWQYHQGDLDEALASLLAGLDLCGREHYVTSLLLDMLGLVYANKNNFLAASEFFEQGLQCKQRLRADHGVARSLRHLGQFHLDWGNLDQAEEYFQKSFRLSLRGEDGAGQANTFHYLGKVMLARAERAARAGHKGAARRNFTKAAEWLDASIRANEEHGRTNLASHAHRDRALLCLAEDELDEAAQHLQTAAEGFCGIGHEEGLARVDEVRGILARRREDFAEARRFLRQALLYFDRTADFLEAARTQQEIARTLAAAGELNQIVVHEFLDALRRAELCRRPELVREIEEELQAIDQEAYAQHVFLRARGRGSPLDTSSLHEGMSEVASVLFLDLQGFTPFCQGLDSGEVMRTVNQMMSDLSEVLERHSGHVTAYLGGGFMALLRGPGHAERAVQAALDMSAVVTGFNRPRAVLGLKQMLARVGVTTGSMTLGNVGTYHKMDFTAIGPPVNLAARLVRSAEVLLPRIGEETYDKVQDRFEFAPGSPRQLDLKGMGQRPVWDVIGRRKKS